MTQKNVKDVVNDILKLKESAVVKNIITNNLVEF